MLRTVLQDTIQNVMLVGMASVWIAQDTMKSRELESIEVETKKHESIRMT